MKQQRPGRQEAVRMAVSEWKRYDGDGYLHNVIMILCDFTREHRYAHSRCELCPMLNRWPLAAETGLTGTVQYCHDEGSAWAMHRDPSKANDKLIAEALEKLLKEME